MNAKPKSPWPKPTMRDNVKRAMDRVGGRKGFDFMGRGMQEALIDQMLFALFQTAAQFSQRGATFDEMVGARTQAYDIAGLDDSEAES